MNNAIYVPSRISDIIGLEELLESLTADDGSGGLTVVIADSRYSRLGHTHSFDNLTNKPTTLYGYGITDALTISQIDDRFNALIDMAPGALNTLGELARQLANDENAVASLTNLVNTKASLNSPQFTGIPTAPTAPLGTNTTQIANMIAVKAEIAAAKGELADAKYTHIQSTPSIEWIVNHNLAKYPSVTILDNTGIRVFADEQHTSLNQTIIKFNIPFSGAVYFN